MPVETQHVWRWFCALGSARTSAMATNPISWSDMHAYFALHRICPEAWEIDAIRGLDEAYMISRSEGGATAVVKGAQAFKDAITSDFK